MNAQRLTNFIELTKKSMKDTVNLPICVEIGGIRYNTTDVFIKFSKDKYPLLILDAQRTKTNESTSI